MSELIKASDNLFDDLGFTEEVAANLKARSQLMIKLTKFIEENNLKQREAADLFGVQQSLISDLTRGKIERLSVDKLINMAAKAGLKVSIVFTEAA